MRYPGYAAAENVQYLDLLSPGEAVARGFVGPVMHILFASIWGHWIGIASLKKRPLLPAAAMLIVAGWIWRLRILHVLHLDAVEEGEAGMNGMRGESAENREGSDDYPRS